MEETKKGMQRIADLGPIGDTIRKRVAALREHQHLSYAALSRLLEEAGRPIGTLALRRIEAGARRVDADDLVALALVLGATPNSLMMDPKLAEGPTRDDLLADDLEAEEEKYEVGLTPAVTAYAKDLWNWLDGRRPLWDRRNVSAAAFEDRNRANIAPYRRQEAEAWQSMPVTEKVDVLKEMLDRALEKRGIHDGND